MDITHGLHHGCDSTSDPVSVFLAGFSGDVVHVALTEIRDGLGRADLIEPASSQFLPNAGRYFFRFFFRRAASRSADAFSDGLRFDENDGPVSSMELDLDVGHFVLSHMISLGFGTVR